MTNFDSTALREITPPQQPAASRPTDRVEQQGGSFSSMLVREGILTREHMEEAKDAARREGLRLSRILVDRHPSNEW